MTKTELRSLYLNRRNDIGDISDYSKRLCDKFFQEVNLSNIGVIHIFLPIEDKNEIDTWEFLRRLWSDYSHIKTVVPVANFSTRTMVSVEVNCDSVITANRYGIPEPEVVDVFDDKLIDMVLTPLLISDQYGFRVGYGGGFYDRFFSMNCKTEVIKVGLSFFSPISEISDINKNDVPLDTCVFLS